TYAELCARAGQAGNALLSLGLEPGERVLLLLDDGPDYPAFLYGALRAGLVPVLLNTLTPAELLAYYAADSAARAIVLDGGLVGNVTAGGTLATA
ncbi:AMP-binding protein, partial [Enterobacter hormaechei]